MKPLLPLRRYVPLLLIAPVALFIGYALGNIAPLQPTAKPAQLAYISNGFTHIVDLATGQDTNIGNLGVEMNHNAPSPDGQWVASWSGPHGSRWSLALLSTRTWQRTEIADYDIAFPTLSWSPDNRQLAFAAMPEGKTGGFDANELFIMDVESRQLQQLTDNDYRDDSPAFSPDGKQLAYTSSADGFNRLFILDIATRESHRVTDQAFGYIPSWSPDGQQIAFSSNHEDLHNQVYVINADGTNLRRISFNPATDDFPFWLP